ncbi:Gfo/Idh/MocA family protein [Kribbella sp. NPDC051620]|uniref:Gfo/Idh/MocA family protein n=1 Tax=Kribbella sp. NPDC051620 TaxID=3364120 RepID=UPI0037958353
MKKIGVGVIGASLDGWAAMSHLPALAGHPEYELVAVSTTRKESAELAAERYGVPAAFDDHQDLIAHPGVELVVVAVKVSHHHELVSAALAAGKQVYSEWPLGVNRAEAEELASLAAGGRTVIGLQGRYAPEIQYARQLIADGYVGRVLGTTVVGSGAAWGAETQRRQAYLFDDSQGATLLTIAAGHTLDTLQYLLGEIAEVSADLVVSRKTVTVIDDGTELPVTAPDQVGLIGTLADGAALSFFYRGSSSRGDNFRWEINGTEGDLVLTSPTGSAQATGLTLAGGRGTDHEVAELTVPAELRAPASLPKPAENVSLLYSALARDLREGTNTVPDFTHALRHHRLIDSTRESATTGRRIPLA